MAIDNQPDTTIIPSEEAHTSAVLHRLIRQAPADYFTLGWLIEHLPNRSFGVILLFLSLISLLPVISIPARFLILLLAIQIILGYRGPVLPDRLVNRRLPSRYLARLERHAIPCLEHLETILRPRWPTLLHSVRRIAAMLVFVLTLFSLLAPLPLANIPPALISTLMALAYIEHDGILLTFTFIAAFALLMGIFIICTL